MPTTIDSLDIQISSSVQKTNDNIDILITKLGAVAENITSIGKNKGLDDFAKKSLEATKRLSNIQNMAKSFSGNIMPEMQKVSKSFEQIAAQYANLGKNFYFKGSTSEIQKQIDKYTNSLETAKLKKEELETAGKTDGKAYEAAVAKTIEYTNVIENLKQQLADVQAAQPQLNFNISGIEETRQAIESIGESIRESVSLPESAFNYNSEAMTAVFGEAAGDIENWAQAVEQFGERAARIMNETSQLNLNVSGIEETEQQIGNFSGQLQNMKNLFMQTFSDLKGGDLFRYLSESVRNYVKSAQTAAGIKIYTEDYKKVLDDIERTEGALEKLEQEQRDLQAAGTSEESKEWQKVTNEIAAAEKALQSYIDKKQEMEIRETDVEFTGGLGNQSWIKTMGAVAGEAMSSLRQRIAEIPGAVLQAVGNIPIIGRVAKEAAFLGKAAFESFRFALFGIAKAAGTAVSAISKIASAIAKLASGIKSTISKLSSMVKSFIGLKGASKGMNASFGVGFKTMLKYGLGIRSLYVLFNKLRNAVKEGMKNLVQYSDETNTSVSLLKNSFTQLKNASAAMIAPFLNAFAPALNQIIQICIKAANAINQLISSIIGNGTWIKAKTLTDDYAASLNKAGKAAKGSLRPFDELKTITTQGGSEDSETSPEDMFETIEVENNFKNLAERLKKMWANADFAEIGEILGIKLRIALESMPWEPIKETAAKIGKSLGTLINGFVEVDGLADSIGRTIGEAINTGIIGINSFLDNTHWDSVGIFIGEGLNGIVNTVDWEGLGHLFAAKTNAIFEVIGNLASSFEWSNFGLQLAASINTFISDFDWAKNGARLGELAKSLLDSIISFLENTNWQKLGNGIADFIGGIDWGGILERLAEGIGAALGGLAALIWGLIEDAWGNVVAWWEETAFEDGQFTMSGLLNGIWEGIKNIGSWIVEHIFTPFIDGFKKAFGIASPSKVMQEMGGFIMQGLLNGISSLVHSAIDIFNKIKEKIVEIWGAIKTKTSEVWNGIKTFVSDLWTGLKTNVSSVFGSIKTTITNIWNGIKTVTTNVWNGIKNAVKTPINGIIGFINGMTSGISSGINGMINALNALSFDVPDWVPLIGGKKFGFNISNISIPQIPMLAKGGIAVQYTPAIIGESGMEAVLPLTNKRTMNMIADSIFENASCNGGYAYSDGFGMSEKRTEELIAETRKQNQLLQEQNRLLEGILNKPSISSGEIFSAAKSVYKGEATRRYGNSAAFDPVWG